MELDDVGFADETEAERPQFDATGDGDTGPALGSPAVSAVMKMLTLDGKPILDPDPLDVDQRALSLAKQ